MSAPRWGDDLDDSDDESGPAIVSPSKDVTKTGVVVPPTHKSRINASGIQIVTSYRPHPANPNQLWKTVTKLKVTTERRREAKSISVKSSFLGEDTFSYVSHSDSKPDDDFYSEPIKIQYHGCKHKSA